MTRYAGHHTLETEWQQEAVGQMTAFPEVEAHAKAGGLHLFGGAVQNGRVKETVAGVQPHCDGVAGAVVGIIGVVEIGQECCHMSVGVVGVRPQVLFQECGAGHGEIPPRQDGRSGGGQADAEFLTRKDKAYGSRWRMKVPVIHGLVFRMLGNHIMEVIVQITEVIGQIRVQLPVRMYLHGRRHAERTMNMPLKATSKGIQIAVKGKEGLFPAV